MTTGAPLRRPYRMVFGRKGAKSIKVTVPYEVVEREARKLGLTVEEFLESHVAVAEYDNFDGVRYIFQPKAV